MIRNVCFAVGTGRCGTNFLFKVLEGEPEVSSSHEKHPLNDTFHRYCKWYNLPVDHDGFLYTKRESIEEDLKRRPISFEASAYLSLSVRELSDAFNAKFILLVRSPDKVINSYIKKGWYARPVQLNDPNKIPSYQDSDQFHHFLGRTLPSGDEFYRWRSLTQVGKLAWFWNMLNREVIRQFESIPASNSLIVKLEELNYDKYVNVIVPFVGFKPTVEKSKFNSIVEERPNSFSGMRKVSSWSEVEKKEFLDEASPMAEYFNYKPLEIINPVSNGESDEQENDKASFWTSLKKFK